jgi:hypothetical protein
MFDDGQGDAAKEPITLTTNELVQRAEAAIEGQWPTWRQDTGASPEARLPHDDEALRSLVQSFKGTQEDAIWLKEATDWLADLARPWLLSLRP